MGSGRNQGVSADQVTCISIGRAITSQSAEVGRCQRACTCACAEGRRAAGNHSGTDKSPDGPLLTWSGFGFRKAKGNLSLIRHTAN